MFGKYKDAVYREAKPKDKVYKIFDGNGLFLLVKPNGAKLWRMKYDSPLDGKEKTLCIGEYPKEDL